MAEIFPGGNPDGIWDADWVQRQADPLLVGWLLDTDQNQVHDQVGEVGLIPVPGGGTTIVFPGVAPFTAADAVAAGASTNPCAPFTRTLPDHQICRF